MVAFYVPWRFLGLDRARVEPASPASLLGVVFVAGGALLLAVCIVEFARSGRGTLSPVDPPRVLVVRGLYKYVRNPMYLSVSTIVLGEALLTRSWTVVVYWVVWIVIVNAFVVFYEEPTLGSLFGTSYTEYTRHVSRWIPRLPKPTS